MLFYRIQQAVSYRYNQEYIPRAGYFGTIYLCPHFRCSPKPALPARNENLLKVCISMKTGSMCICGLGMSYKCRNNSYDCI